MIRGVYHRQNNGFVQNLVGQSYHVPKIHIRNTSFDVLFHILDNMQSACCICFDGILYAYKALDITLLIIYIGLHRTVELNQCRLIYDKFILQQCCWAIIKFFLTVLYPYHINEIDTFTWHKT